MPKIDHETAWQAVKTCDQNFDGTFYYAVKSTGIYCHPSCKSKTPLKANVSFYEFSDSAERAGFRACKRCRPDKVLHK